MFDTPSMPPPPPPPPQMDDAARAEEMTKRYGRRRGKLATMFAGDSAPAPSVAVRTALGGG